MVQWREGIHQSLKKIAVNLNTLPQRRAAASACSSGCLKSFCVRPEFGNGHSEVTADRGHDIASGIGYAALDESKIIAAVSKRIGHGYLGNSALYTHFRDGASEYLTRRFGPAFSIRPNRFAHPLMVVVACKE